MGAFCAFLWSRLAFPGNGSIHHPQVLVAALIGLVPVHELIHAAAHPGSGSSPFSTIGVWPSRLLFYAHYTGELSRNRFIGILVAPLLVISGLPFLVCAVAGRAPVEIAFISVPNAAASCGDAIGVVLLLFQVPAAATTRNQGYWTYWKVKERMAGGPAVAPRPDHSTDGRRDGG